MALPVTAFAVYLVEHPGDDTTCCKHETCLSFCFSRNLRPSLIIGCHGSAPQDSRGGFHFRVLDARL